MSNNPLLPTDQSSPAPPQADAAVELIRSKVARAFQDEPDAIQELAEVPTQRSLSKHQLYMQNLSGSGKSLAEIQTEWHHYYTMLPDDEKHAVWQEFYAANQHTPYQKLFQKQQEHKAASVAAAAAGQTSFNNGVNLPQVIPQYIEPARAAPEAVAPSRSRRETPAAVAKIKHQIVDKISAGGKLRLKHHFQSLLFGLGSGVVVLVILLFSFFNQYIIAPFIQPSRNVSSTPIILGDAASDSSTPQVVIPKINVQIPLIFSVATNDENQIENALQDGVVHYPSTVMPGQNGNTAFFGHSSNNIFNPGKYKFAFVLLHTITTGDVFYITSGGKTYAYQVFAREVVPPSQVSVLTDTKGKTATATLITCDPPGTSNNRLVVWGEQISPTVSGNTAASSSTVATTAAPKQLANNGPSLWSRMIGGIEFWH